VGSLGGITEEENVEVYGYRETQRDGIGVGERAKRDSVLGWRYEACKRGGRKEGETKCTELMKGSAKALHFEGCRGKHE
jgi:hypothetical protein